MFEPRVREASWALPAPPCTRTLADLPFTQVHLIIAKNIVLTLMIATVLVFAIWENRPAAWTTMQFVGIGLTALGFTLWSTARFQLGPSFSVTAQARRLVTRGIYSKISNPIYIFGSCLIIGVILTIGRPIWLFIFVALIPLQIWRAKKEAKVLESAFGDEYRKYRAKTWF